MYRGFDAEVRAAGCKALYHQLEKARFGGVLRAMSERPRMKAIHLRRDNLLRAHLSYRIAHETRVFGIESPADRTTTTVRLDPGACIRSFERTNERAARFAAALSGIDVFELAYERLSERFDEEIDRVQAFLEIPRVPLTPRTLQQEVRPLSVAIENFGELRAALDPTPWARFFDD